MSLSMCTAVQVSLVRLLTSWGIHPTAVTGHSSGEVGAAYAAGALNLRQALAIVYFRGVLTQAFVENSKLKGGMLAAGLGMDDIQPYFKDLASGKAVVACVNSPSSVTVSGDLLAVEEVEARLRSDKIFARKLKVAAAFHSHHMELLAEDYRKVLRKEINHTGYFGKVLYASPVTGQRIDGAHELTPEHWVKNMVQPVLFAQSLRSMCMGDATSSAKNTRQSIDTIIEIGPHGALAGPIRQNLTSSELKDYGISYQTCLVRGQDAVKTMQELACSLLTKGYPVDLEAVNFPKEHGELRVIHNLPVYPWNHSVRHFVEPRVNKEYRNRKNPPHELLGSLIKGANTLEPTWRHFIRPTEIPWVRDHLVQSGIVYPGAGCIAMAIEAVRQSRQRMDKDLLGYNLRDIQIMKALVIPETSEGVEVQLALRNCSDKILDANTWQEFHVYSVDGDSTWSEHCRGFISAKFRTSDGYTPTSKQELGKLDIDIGAYSRRVDIKDFFKSLRDVGIHHGPSFQNLISIQTGNRQSLAMFEVADSASMMPAKFQRPHVVHPITLDALFQAAYSAVSIDDAKKMGGTVPRSIKSLYVSHDISSEAGHRFQILSSLHQATRQGFDVSISTIDENATERSPVLQVEGLHYQSVGESLVQDQSTAGDRLCMTIQWERSLDLANSNHLKSSLVLSPDPAETVVIEDLRRATYHIIHDTLAELTKSDIQAFDWHHQKFYEWMKYHDDRAARNELAPQSSKWARSSGGVKQLLFDNVSSRSVNGEMLCRLGKQLIAILRKEVAPLELMLENKLLYTYYENALRVDRSLAQVEKIVKLFAHQNPHGKVLEIGGGTGACTGTALMALGGGDSGGSPRFSQYDFTDVSSGFFEMAREKFGAWGNMINYTKLDIEQDPVAQSFEAGSYDLIIACQVLHATKAMDKTLSNVRKLLKPGGKLLMVETTQDAFDVQLVFGTLPGWWLSMCPGSSIL